MADKMLPRTIHIGTIAKALRAQGYEPSVRTLRDVVPLHIFKGGLDPRFAPLLASKLASDLGIPAASILEAFAPFTRPEPLSVDALFNQAMRAQLGRTWLRSQNRSTTQKLAFSEILASLTAKLSDTDLNVKQILSVCAETVQEFGIPGANVYLFEKGTNRLVSFSRGEMAETSRYETQQDLLPGEKRHFLRSDTDVMLFDRTNMPKDMLPADAIAAASDFERDLGNYFRQGKDEDAMKQALAQNLYWRIKLPNGYDVLIQANNHLALSRLVEDHKPITKLPILEEPAKIKLLFATLKTLGLQIAKELNKAELSQVAENLAKRLSLLHDLHIKIDLVTEITSLFDTVLDNLDSQFNKEGMSPIGRSSVLLWEETENAMLVASHRQINDDHIRSVKVKKGQGIAGHVFESGQSMMVEDASVSGQISGRGGNISEGSFMCVPIVSESEKYGVLSVRSRFKGAFKTEDLRHLEDIGRILGNAINRARSLEAKEAMIAELKTLNTRLTYDELTGFYIRKTGLAELERYVAEANRQESEIKSVWYLSALFMDIDHFKLVNDGRNGHKGGDIVLSGIGKEVILPFLTERLKGFEGAGFLPIRLGGEELGIIFVNVPPQDVVEITAELRERIKAKTYSGANGDEELLLDNSDKPLQVTVSAGITHLVYGDSPENLLSRSDKAMYYVKHHGRDGQLEYASYME